MWVVLGCQKYMHPTDKPLCYNSNRHLEAVHKSSGYSYYMYMHRQTAAQTDLSLSFLIWSRSSSSRSCREDAVTTESLKMKRWTEYFNKSILELCLSVSGV